MVLDCCPFGHRKSHSQRSPPHQRTSVRFASNGDESGAVRILSQDWKPWTFEMMEMQFGLSRLERLVRPASERVGAYQVKRELPSR